MSLGPILERAMQLIVALKWKAHQTGEVTPEMEAEARETLAQLYGAKRDVADDDEVTNALAEADVPTVEVKREAPAP